MLVGTNGKLWKVSKDNFHVIINNDDLTAMKRTKVCDILPDNELKWYKQVNGVTQKPSVNLVLSGV